MIFFWVPLRVLMFVRIVCVANSPEKVSLCLADLNLSRILNQCQLLSKGHEQNFARKHNYWTLIQEMWTWFYVLASIRMTTCQGPCYSRLQLEATRQMWVITLVSQKEIIHWNYEIMKKRVFIEMLLKVKLSSKHRDSE